MVEGEAGLAQCRGKRLGKAHEHLIGFDRMGERHSGQRRQPFADARRAGVRSLGQPQPQAVGDIGLELRRQKAHFAQQMAAAHAPAAQRLVGRAHRGRAEIDHRLGGHGAVLGGAEGQHVDPGAPGQRRGCAAEADKRIGEAGAVHVHGEAVAVRHLGQSANLFGGVDRSRLAGLADAECHRRRLVLAVMAAGGHRRGQRLRRDAPVGAVETDQLGATGIELWRPAFVAVHMRVPMAVDSAVRWRQLGQAKCVGGGSGDHRVDHQIGLEKIGEDPLQTLGDRVGAIGMGAALVGPGERRHDLRRRRRLVVRAKVHARPPRVRP